MLDVPNVMPLIARQLILNEMSKVMPKEILLVIAPVMPEMASKVELLEMPNVMWKVTPLMILVVILDLMPKMMSTMTPLVILAAMLMFASEVVLFVIYTARDAGCGA